MSSEELAQKQVAVGPEITAELEDYRDWIGKFRNRQVGEIKMQKIRLQLGTYAQRQEGVQMNRIKFPGGRLKAHQLVALADCADKYGSGFIHFTTREDAQLYYLKLEECPDMMYDLAAAGITSREACGNTVRNITACHRSGVSESQVFDVTPYAEALYEFLVRNKWNQVMGRKCKIAFESCHEDHAGMLYHDFGFQAKIQDGKRGFRTYIAGGLGAVPMLGHLFAEFLPEEDMLKFGAAAVRIFDRYGERKNRMQARMKYLAKKMGAEELNEAIRKEMELIDLPESVNDYLEATRKSDEPPAISSDLPAAPEGIEGSDLYNEWLKDNVDGSCHEGFRAVNVRLKLGDILTDESRKLAAVAETFSDSELKITIEQNLYLPWVPEAGLPALFAQLTEIGLAGLGAETIIDTTTCPGADTCRLGITSAKGLGAKISDELETRLTKYKELGRDVRVKISGCPNSCAQHFVANIAFQGAASKKDGKSVPSHMLFIGGQQDLDNTAVAQRIGKYPAKNCPEIVETLMATYEKERSDSEPFNDCMNRLGKDRIKELIAHLEKPPAFEDDPEFYQDWGHDNESFAVRQGVKGECAGAPVQEKAPTLTEAQEHLSQAEAFVKHNELANAQIEVFEAMAGAARVPLYKGLCDPFTNEQALWEFENIFIRKNGAGSEWLDSADRFAVQRDEVMDADQVKDFIETGKRYLAECEKQLDALG